MNNCLMKSRYSIFTQQWTKESRNNTPKHINRKSSNWRSIQPSDLRLWPSKASSGWHCLLGAEDKRCHGLPGPGVHHHRQIHSKERHLRVRSHNLASHIRPIDALKLYANDCESVEIWGLCGRQAEGRVLGLRSSYAGKACIKLHQWSSWGKANCRGYYSTTMQWPRLVVNGVIFMAITTDFLVYVNRRWQRGKFLGGKNLTHCD